MWLCLWKSGTKCDFTYWVWCDSCKLPHSGLLFQYSTLSVTESMTFLALTIFSTEKLALRQIPCDTLTKRCWQISVSLTWQRSIQTCWARAWVSVSFGLWEGLLILSCQQQRGMRAPWDESSALGPACFGMKALGQFNRARSLIQGSQNFVLQAG